MTPGRAVSIYFLSPMPEAPLVASPARRPRKRRRIWLIRLIMLAVSTAVGLVIAEFGLRKMLPAYDPTRQIGFVKNQYGVYTGTPNANMVVATPKGDYRVEVHFNRYGFRDVKDLLQAGPNDLFAVGDSFTMGSGVGDGQRYSDVAERALGVPIYNIAIPGDFKGYRDLLGYAEKLGAHPHRIIVGVCMENDLMDYSEAEPKPATTGKLPYKEYVRYYMKQHSALYLALTQLQGTFGSHFFEMLGVARSVDELTRSNAYSDQVLASSVATLLDVTRDRDALVVLIPSRGLWSGKNREQEARIHQRFAELLQGEGLKVLDMRPVLEATGRPLNYYFKTDPHWNAEGQRLTGEELARRLR